MSGSISNCTASVSLATFSKIQALTTKGPLVDITCFSSAEWHPIMLQLQETVGSERPDSEKATTKKSQLQNSNRDSSPVHIKKIIITIQVLRPFLNGHYPPNCSINCKSILSKPNTH